MKNLTKYSIILCLISLLQGCEVLSMITSMMPSSSGISAELQVGDNENSLSKNRSSIGDIEAEDNATVNVHTNTSDSHIDSAENVIVQEGIPLWMLIPNFLLLLLFWELPRSSSIIRWIHARFK